MEKEKLTTNSSINLYQHVTDKIIEALEQGVGPWIRPWDNSDAQFGIQRNGFTGRPYHGVNALGNL
jgi:antirestriction protein ArdC